MTECLKYSPITHAHITRVRDPELDADINGRSVVRYLRFVQPVRSARGGLPYNMWPLKEQDHQLPMLLEGYCGTAPTFELFTAGSMSPHACMLYLRALSIHGFKNEAGALVADLDAGFADGMFTGGFGLGMGRGNEFLYWDGLPGGYEGTFGPNMGALYAVAIEQELFTPP